MSLICLGLSLFMFAVFAIVGVALLAKLWKSLMPSSAQPAPRVSEVAQASPPAGLRGTLFNPDDPVQRQVVLERMAAPTPEERAREALKAAATKHGLAEPAAE